MNTRELYRKKYEAEIHEWKGKLEVLEARAEKLTAEARIEMKPHLDAIAGKLDLATKKLEKLSAATDDTWHAFVDDVDGAWRELRAAVEGAYDALKGEASGPRPPDASEPPPEVR